MTATPQPPRSRETQAVVWLDRVHANVYRLLPTDDIDEALRGVARVEVRHLPGDGRGDDHYFHEVAHALSNARRILVVGPGPAKLSLVRHLVHHDPSIEQRVVGLETVDDVADERLRVYARAYLG